MSESVYYFAYGSNMDPDRFVERVGAWRSRHRARLDGYRIAFARVVQSEGGGGAIIERAPGERVDGIAYEITDDQLAAMDEKEFDSSRDQRGAGTRMEITVHTADDELTAQVYTTTGDGGSLAPSEAYLGHILRGLESAGYGEPALDRVRRAAARAEPD